MFKITAKLLTFLLIILASATSPALADESGEIENLRRRLEKLESRETETEGFIVVQGRKTLNIWGALEIEAGYLDAKDLPAESDLNVATALLGLDFKINDRVEGRIALLHEEGEEPDVALDEAHLAISWPKIMTGTATITAGKNYLPFGTFNSSMVSDPLTLELGETNKTALLTAWETDKFSFQLGVYNGDMDTTGHDVIDNGVVAVTVSPKRQVEFGASYICDLTETNAELLADATTVYDDNVTAASAYLSLDFSPVTMNLEYLGALKKFSEAMLTDPDRAVELTGRKPRSWFIELGFAPNDDWAIGCRYDEAKDYQDNAVRYGATASYGLEYNTVLSLEYLYSDFARDTEDTRSQVTIQLAMEF